MCSLELYLLTCIMLCIERLTTVFAELCTTYYKDEGRRVKARIEKRNFSSVELSIRYCFKVGRGISLWFNLALLVILNARGIGTKIFLHMLGKVSSANDFSLL